MTHFVGIVVGDELESQLKPYDENISVERYKNFYDYTPPSPDEPIEENKLPYPVYYAHTKGVDVHSLIEINDCLVKMDWGGVEDGKVFEWSTYNPKSKWDWYSFGGRWEQWCTEQGFSPRTTVGEVEWDKIEFIPSVIVEDGEWVEAKRFGWFGSYTETDEADNWEEDWRQYFKEMSTSHPETTITFVDFHI